MQKMNFKFNLPVIFFKEKSAFVAYSPALDLSTAGKTFASVKKRFTEAANLFFEEIIKKGTINEALEDLGWQKTKKNWLPPQIISHEPETIQIPVSV